ncbi:MAG: hypothetical protein RIS88_582 [Pseudomonadota bacterium]|jgi:uncharacterized protein YndB with AHSA1/START domain
MTSPVAAASFPLQIERTLHAPRAAIWRCWTEPDLLMQWYCPLPWRVTQAQMEMRSGGRFFVQMQCPQGEQVPCPGVCLQVETGRRLVFTDACLQAWVPSPKPFMVGDITLDDAPGGGTHYLARGLHWNAQDRDEHLKMGFEGGWNAAADQLEALARTLRWLRGAIPA